MIEVEYIGLDKLANNMKIIADDMKITTNNITDIIESVNSAWNDAASNKFVEYMKNKNITSLKKLYDTLNDYSYFLKNVSKAYKILDENYSSKNIGG